MIKYSIVKRKNSKFWYGRTWQDGKVLEFKSLGVLKKADAEAWLRQKNGSIYQQDEKSMQEYAFGASLQDFSRSLVAQNKDSATGLTYYNRIKLIESLAPAGQSLSSIERMQCQKWIDELTRNYAPKTIQETVRLAKRFFKRYGHDPFAGTERPKLRKTERPFWTMEEIEQILTLTDAQNAGYWSVMAYGGLRSAEAYALRFGDINHQKSEITILSGKGAKTRIVPISKKLLKYLPQQGSGKPGEKLFPELRTAPTSRQRVLVKAVDGMQFIKEGPVTLHRFRHSFASNLIRAGANIKSVQLLLGHASIDITLDLYGHLLTDDLARAIDLL